MVGHSLASLEALPLAELVRRASTPPLAEEAESALASEVAAGDPEAREQLVAGHLRDVVDVAIAHRGGGVAVDVLVRRGLAGLVAAAREFDPERHPPFPAFARRHIRREVRSVLLSH